MPLRHITRFVPATLLALSLAGHTAAQAATPPGKAAARPAPARKAPAVAPPAATATATTAPLAPAAAGMIVGLDPETGVIGPASRAQRLQLLAEEENMLSRSTLGLVERKLPGGGMLLDLGGRFQEFSFVRLRSTGRPVFGCSGDAATVHHCLVHPAEPAAVLEDR